MRGMVGMAKFGKELTLTLAPYRTVKIMVCECGSFEECDKELKKELDRHPDVKELNKEEIKKVLG